MTDQYQCPECEFWIDLDTVSGQCPNCGSQIDEDSSFVTVKPMEMSSSDLDQPETHYLKSTKDRAIKVANYPTVEIEVNVQYVDGVSMNNEDFQIIEQGTEKDVHSIDIAHPQLNLAVVFDDTGSMSGEITAMQEGVKDLTEAIVDRGIDAHYALVSFKDEAEIDLEFTDDATALKAAVDDLKASGGGDAPEDSYGAIEMALELDRRDSANDVIVHITDAPAHYRKDPDAGNDIPVVSDVVDNITGDSEYTSDEVAQDLNDKAVNFFAVAPDSDDDQSSVKTLAAKAGGLWTDINAEDFDEILEQLTELLTSTYTITYWTSLSAGDTEEIEVRYEHPTRGMGRDTCFVSVPEDA